MRMNNNWKDYEVKPDEGLFDAVRRRLRRRRALRIGGVTLAVVAIAAVALLLQKGDNATDAIEAGQGAPVAVVSEPAVDASMPEVVGGDDKAKAKKEAENVVEIVEPSHEMAVLTHELPKIKEPEDDILFDESLLGMLAEAPVCHRQGTETPVVKHDSANAVQVPVQNKENATTAKVGAVTPDPYKEDNILWAPNIITPNGDVAENRVFRVVASSDVSEFHLYIYNRGGRLVFKSSNINEEWNASHNGTPVPQGAYVWVATFRGTDGSSHREAGTVTVVW